MTRLHIIHSISLILKAYTCVWAGEISGFVTCRFVPFLIKTCLQIKIAIIILINIYKVENYFRNISKMVQSLIKYAKLKFAGTIEYMK